MTVTERKLPFSTGLLVGKEEVKDFLNSLVEHYKEIAKTDLPDSYRKYPFWKDTYKVIAAITRSRVYFFFITDKRLVETVVKAEDAQTNTRLESIADAINPHFRDVAEIMGIKQAMFTFAGEAKKGDFSYDRARDIALELIKKHYCLIEDGEGLKPTSVLEKELSREIFVVHGHDEAAKESVARVLEKLGLKPIILSEQPNLGLTLLEKFVSSSNVTFAIVILMPDDKGGAKSVSFDKQKFRARQNVIFELGYFFGKLDRKRVFTLFGGKEDFEFLSDIEGIAYTKYDEAGKWKFDLVRELKECGYDVDANKLVEN